MENQQFNALVTINPEELDRLNRIMTIRPADSFEYGKDEKTDELLLKAFQNIGEDVSMFSAEMEFSDGKSVELNVYPPKDNKSTAYAKATLYDPYGEPLSSSGAGYPLNGEWLLSDEKDNHYVLDVKKARVREEAAEPAHFNAVLSVEPDELAHLSRILSFEQINYAYLGREDELLASKDPAVLEFVESCQQGKDYLFRQEIPFSNGCHAELSILPPANISDQTFAQAFLYNAQGLEVDFTDMYTNLAGDWHLKDENGNTYAIDVREREREMDKTPFGKHLQMLRSAVLQTIKTPEVLRCKSQFVDQVLGGKNSFFAQREEAYIRLANDLPKDLEAIVSELAQHGSEDPAEQTVGNYLYTGHLDEKPFGARAEEAAEKLVPALRDFGRKMQMVEAAYRATVSRDLPENAIPKDVVMFLDASRELRDAAPEFLCDHVCTTLGPFSSEELYATFDKIDSCIDTLRGRIDPEGRESLAKKTMRDVYSKYKDTVDYDKLNEKTVIRLVESGASDKTLHEVAEIARTLDPAIQDTKKYTKHLLIQANIRHNLAAGK